MSALMKNDKIDRMFGCLFGAFIGDSIGSFCEFQTASAAEKLS